MAKITGFNISQHLWDVCDHMTQTIVALQHIQMKYVGVGAKRVRNDSSYGVLATTTALRFSNGTRFDVRNGRQIMYQKIVGKDGVELLYIINFLIPRYLIL